MQGLYLHTQQHKLNKRIPTSIPRLRFEPTTSAFGQAKTVHILDRAPSVIGTGPTLFKT
jgi:hypothetical protein